jgi:DNA binding domain, excisionase family
MFDGKVKEVNYKTQTQPQHEKRTYTVEEIQGILGISKSTAYALVREGQFKCINVGRHIRISKKSFDEWLDSQA